MHTYRGSVENDSTGMRIKNTLKLRLVQISANESVELFWDLPPVRICGASEPFHGLVHAIRPEEVSSLAIALEWMRGGRARTHMFQF